MNMDLKNILHLKTDDYDMAGVPNSKLKLILMLLEL